jgi:sialate O-acetylesterase
MLSRRWSVLAVLVVAGFARADVTLYPLFTDNMVLQQGAKLPVWGKAAPGEEVTVTLLKGKMKAGTATAKTDDQGDWKVTLDEQTAGSTYRLEVNGKNAVALTNVAVGEVWVCSGQSNMEWPLNASYDADRAKAGALNANLRLFTVAKKTSTTPLTDSADLTHFSGWASSKPDNVGGFSAVAFHFGQTLQKALNVPVGLIHTSWGGTPAESWASVEALAAVPELKYYADRATASAAQFAKDKKAVGPNTPGSLYNAMIHPLLPFPVKGAIWYQGESNAGKAYEYRTLFRTMIQDWRTKWGTDIAFHLVQLAPWHANDAEGVTWAELREAQTEATKKLKGVGMAVITDVGDLLDIHPRDKTTVGNRLARSALAKTYEKSAVGSGPTYKESKTDGDKVTLAFDNVGGGLMARYGTLNGFTVCGEDQYFYPAKAVIQDKDTIVVTCDKVAKPVAVRFCWKNFPVANVYNKDGLPMVPFRTDDFPWTTMPKK